MPRRKKAPTAPESASGEAVTSLKYPATRKNIPPAGLEAQGFVKEEAAVYYRHDPHLPPALRSSPDPAATDRLQELLATARKRACDVYSRAACALAGLPDSYPFEKKCRYFRPLPRFR